MLTGVEVGGHGLFTCGPPGPGLKNTQNSTQGIEIVL